jgi:hypothetical protein
MLIFVLLLAGCVAQQTLESANKALEGAATAEKKLGESGAAALSGVANVTSRISDASVQLTSTLAALQSDVAAAQPAIAEIGAILSDVHASTTALREKVERPIPTWVYVAFSGLGLGLVIVFVHNVFAHRKHRKLILELHGKHPATAPPT